MCVVAHVIDRVARELREDARRLEGAAINSETELPVANDPKEALRLLLIDVRAVAARARRAANQLDGKE